MIWESSPPATNDGGSGHELATLRDQLDVMADRVERLFATATDLLGSEDLDVTLARITESAAHELRNPRCVLVVRARGGEDAQCHHRGLNASQAHEVAAKLLAEPSQLPATWLVAPVCSHRRDYGWLVAINDSEGLHFPEEQRLLNGFAGYAAAALDLATALAESRRRHGETTALLDFARSLAGASRKEVANRLAEAIPQLVDCDRVWVYLEDGGDRRLKCAATYGYPPDLDGKVRKLEIVRGDADPGLSREVFAQERPRAVFFDRTSRSHFVRKMFDTFGAEAIAYQPIVARGKVLGCLGIAVDSDPERLRETSELQNRLSGIAAQAAVGLENGELIDHISHQASHDPLTGLVNRAFFTERFEQTVERVRAASAPFGLFYLDLDKFKNVNDEHGHDVGDELLRQVARRLLDVVRAEDTVARLGGDEFAIIIGEVADRSQLELATERMHAAFEPPFLIGGLVLRVRASVGGAIWPDDAAELAALLRCADASMYAAKRLAA